MEYKIVNISYNIKFEGEVPSQEVLFTNGFDVTKKKNGMMFGKLKLNDKYYGVVITKHSLRIAGFKTKEEFEYLLDYIKKLFKVTSYNVVTATVTVNYGIKFENLERFILDKNRYTRLKAIFLYIPYLDRKLEVTVYNNSTVLVLGRIDLDEIEKILNYVKDFLIQLDKDTSKISQYEESFE